MADAIRPTPPESPAPADLADLFDPGVLVLAEPPRERTFVMLGKALLRAIVLGVLCYYCGLYSAATEAGGGPTLLVPPLVSVALFVLFWHYEPAAAVVNYRLGVSAVWIGYYMGSVSLSAMVDAAWFFGFFWFWVFATWIGGRIVAVRHERRPHSAAARIARALALVAVVVTAGLLGRGFAALVLFENRPIASVRATRMSSLGSVAFSSDGETLAAIRGYLGDRQGVQLWDATTGRRKEVSVEEQGNEDATCVAVEFTGDPPLLAIASTGSGRSDSVGKVTIRMRDVATGEVRQCFQWDDDLLGWAKPIFSRNGKSFVYAAADGHIRVFDLEAGRNSVDLARDKSDVGCLAATPACDVLACATGNGKVEIWDVGAGQHQPVGKLDRQVSAMDFSPDGRLLACGAEDGCVEIIDVSDMQKRVTIQCFEAARATVHAVAFSPDGKTLACGGGEQGFTRVVDTTRWTIVASLRTWGGWHISALAFSADGTRLATGGNLSQVNIWDVPSLKLEQLKLEP